ncbi:MAG: prolyl oligopeptidase family serine peptidase [Actinomycetota bacterium]|nr:prolyl oligopeptidase family serine peptidase [Actinomycetota bacterium]
MGTGQEIPYGSWPSPISATSLVQGVSSVTGIVAEGQDIWWSESRPDESGRTAIVCAANGGPPREITPPDSNVRTRVHEYGGGAWWVHQSVLFYVEFSDQRLRKMTEGGDPIYLTPEPPTGQSWRFADGRVTPDGLWYICVREVHHHLDELTIEPDNQLVAIATDGSLQVNELVVGADFYAFPRPSPEGEFLTWVQWNHPSMPWWGTELWIGDLQDGQIVQGRKIAGGEEESVSQPEWSLETQLYFLSDRSGWSNLYRFDAQDDELIIGGEFDIGQPLWQLGQSRYVILSDESAVAAITKPDGTSSLASTSNIIALEWSSVHELRADGDDNPVFVAASHNTGSSIVKGVEDGQIIQSPKPHGLAEEYFAHPSLRKFSSLDGKDAYVRFYRPAHPSISGPKVEKPPLLVLAHGGPTGSSRNELSLALRYWTSRGWAVADVDYRGSTGYGRQYMEALDGEWGIVDVADCVAAARYLTAQGEVDGERIAIKGGSAGGFTVLAALAFYQDFGAGASRYGIADLEILAQDTHKFESRYLDRLIGEYPSQRHIYQDRSPINHTEKFTSPMIILQGSEDAVVPPNQAELVVSALQEKKIRHSYLLFDGEGHGFRNAENIVAALEAEYSFFAQIFGFEPSEPIPRVVIG